MKNDVHLLKIGKRLKFVRKKLSLLQKDMAEDLKISASYLCEIENGKANPGPEFFIKLFSVYKISMDYLVLGVGNMFIHSGGKRKRKELEKPQFKEKEQKGEPGKSSNHKKNKSKNKMEAR